MSALACENQCLRGFANNKDADQFAHSSSLIRAFVICILESISRLATRKISIFLLDSVVEQAGLNLSL